MRGNSFSGRQAVEQDETGRGGKEGRQDRATRAADLHTALLAGESSGEAEPFDIDVFMTDVKR
ncbi:type II toxin-antitoxin system ParD family antitoxin [Leucobacter sp. USHLN153]|uniref:type II toxin-antitoxin system ParD family antitoxin n=1 Tax=Leucobacter sp. USHLN153 TaxID=3081268 RepID=UPI003FA5844E